MQATAGRYTALPQPVHDVICLLLKQWYFCAESSTADNYAISDQWQRDNGLTLHHALLSTRWNDDVIGDY